MISRIDCQYDSPIACAPSYWPLSIACRPPRITSAIYAAENSITPIKARRRLSKFTPSGRNNGNITEAMNSTVIRGTPRQNSMKIVHKRRATGISDRRPRAKIIPSGKEATIPVTATTNVISSPPQSRVSTGSRPKSTAPTPLTAL